MPYENIIHFLHVAGWVFWLGTDIGVFMSARFSDNREYSVETRLAMLTLLSKLDKIPRVSVPVIFTTGVLLANNYGVDFIPAEIGGPIGALWFAITLLGVTRDQHSPFANFALKANTVAYVASGLFMGGSAIWSLMGADIMPGWLAVKWLAFSWASVFSIGIIITLKPAIDAYMRLGSEGATEEVNSALSKHLGRVYSVVLMVYLGTIVAAYFGINKVF